MSKLKTVGLVSLGCAKNQVDGEVLLGILRDHGYRLVSDPAKAEIIFVNTCGFIESAKQESIDAILEMAEYKKTGVLKKLFVTGCLAQRYSTELLDEIPEIDGMMGVAEYTRTLEMMADAETGARPLFCGEGARFFPQKRVLTTGQYAAYVKISDGCDNRCTYCAIPLIRGGYRSRAYADILAECRELAQGGVTEITLIAQDTSRYGSDFPEKTLLLPRLLTEVSQIPGIHWVRVLYTYPDTVTDELLDTITSNPKIAPYLDLPLQHIDDVLLRRMNRRGSSELIRTLITKCKARGVTVRTTMIVGFPGETQAQFETLLDFVREMRFDRLGAFSYSPEEGTLAAQFPDQIAEAVKARRLDQLMMMQQGISLEHNEQRVGEVTEVLVEGTDENGNLFGRSLLEAPESDGVIVFSARSAHEPGDYVRVRITGADAYDLTGEEVDTNESAQ